MRPETPNRPSRPLSASGLSPMARKTLNEHVVKDSNYYKNLLINRLSDLSNAMSEIKAEVHEQNNRMKEETAISADKVSVLEDIDQLRTELYDVNCAIEKLRLREDERGFDQLVALRAEATESGVECERLLVIKHELVDMLKQNDEFISKKSHQVHDYTKNLTEDEKGIFERRLGEIRDLKYQSEVTRVKVVDMARDIKLIETRVKGNPNIGRFAELDGRKKSLETKKSQLQEQLSVYSFPQVQQKEHILSFVKEMNSKNAEIESLVKQIRDDTKKSDEMLLAIRSDQRDRSEKFNLISKKKTEIEEFIQRSADEQKSLDSLIASFQKDILEKCERLASIRNQERDRPEIELLNSDIKDSQFTSEQLNRELALRTAELSRLDDVEATYLDQVASLGAQITALNVEKCELENIDGIKTEHSNQIATLEGKLRLLKHDIDEYATQIQNLQKSLNVQVMELEKDPSYAKLLLLDEKLRNILTEIDTLNSRIRDAQLLDERRRLTELVGKLNQKLQYKL